MSATSYSPGLSRYATHLPPVAKFVTLGEGNTPLIPLPSLARRLGLRELSAKLESHNPTGSYKDRVAAMSLSLALQRKCAGWIATSSGNAGLAMAAYGARAGIPGFLCLVGSAPLEKRLPLMPYGLGVVAVDGIGRHSTGKNDTSLVDQVCDAAERHHLFLGITAHAFNPAGMRGIDTLAYELAEQCPSMTHAYVPTGGGGLLTAITRGLERRGLRVRVVACQPRGCAPIVDFLEGRLPAPEVARCESEISALQIPSPPDGALATEAVLRSDGWGTAPNDDQILSAQRLLAEAEGVFAEPASAAAVAALQLDVQRGRITARDHPVLIVTGAGWKDLGRFAPDADRLHTVGLADVTEHIEKWVADRAPARPREA